MTGPEALLCAIGLAFVTSAIATLLRAGMDAPPNPTTRRVPLLRVLATTVALTLLVSIGLLLSSLAINGSVVSSLDSVEDYQRIGLWMTAVGGYAGLSRRGTFELIRRRFAASAEEHLDA